MTAVKVFGHRGDRDEVKRRKAWTWMPRGSGRSIRRIGTPGPTLARNSGIRASKTGFPPENARVRYRELKKRRAGAPVK